MTIAACYVSSEGIVLGADSTSTLSVTQPGGVFGALHHLNYAQKVFEVGEGGTLGVTMWGMGAIGNTSHRTFIAEFGDAVQKNPPSDMANAAQKFSEFFWSKYSSTHKKFLDEVQRINGIDLANRSPEDKQSLEQMTQVLSGGFCLAGRVAGSRESQAYEISYSPDMHEAPQPALLPPGRANFWGCPNFIERILYGADSQLFASILQSGHWKGTDQELEKLMVAQIIGQPRDLPLREAVDWVNTVIYTTIKAMKFSHHLPVCGGPIEIAVISSDRPFRWVCHKPFTAALD